MWCYAETECVVVVVVVRDSYRQMAADMCMCLRSGDDPSFRRVSLLLRLLPPRCPFDVSYENIGKTEKNLNENWRSVGWRGESMRKERGKSSGRRWRGRMAEVEKKIQFPPSLSSLMMRLDSSGRCCAVLVSQSCAELRKIPGTLDRKKIRLRLVYAATPTIQCFFTSFALFPWSSEMERERSEMRHAVIGSSEKINGSMRRAVCAYFSSHFSLPCFSLFKKNSTRFDFFLFLEKTSNVFISIMSTATLSSIRHFFTPIFDVLNDAMLDDGILFYILYIFV